MKYFIFLSILCCIISTKTVQGFDSVTFKKEKILFYTPQMINKKFFDLEFGFITHKKFESIDYDFNAFASFFLGEESYTTDPDLRVGQLGFKGGVYLPTQPWVQIFVQLSFGYAKTAQSTEPWFGKNEQAQTRDDVFLAEVALLYQYKVLIMRLRYQVNNRSYLTRKSFFSFGANF